MADLLRPIALTVTEPRAGHFHWLLLEGTGEGGVYDRCVTAADEPYDSFEKAAKAGLLQWTRLADGDLRRGPRSSPPSRPLEPEPGPWSRPQDAQANA